jgi:hypothetical protein
MRLAEHVTGVNECNRLFAITNALGLRAALVKLQRIEELFNALTIVLSACVDYQQRV